jgi:hypothetical protein
MVTPIRPFSNAKIGMFCGWRVVAVCLVIADLAFR